MTKSDLKTKLSAFNTKNLRRILRIFWPETISSQHLLAHCNQDGMDTIIMHRRWRWIGNVMRREPGNISRSSLDTRDLSGNEGDPRTLGFSCGSVAVWKCGSVELCQFGSVEENVRL